MGSRATYGYMQEIQTHDSKEDEQITARPMFEEMFANEAYLRAVPRTIATVRPDRFTTAPTFMPGDLISLSGGSALGGGFSGTALVYEYELSIDTDGIAEYGEIIATADGI
jgi:hypothetical protein